MITFDEFITKYTNKPVDYDGVYPNQCMDLMHLYKVEVLGLPDRYLLAQPYAYQVWVNFKPEWGTYFEKVTNTPLNAPRKGDILVFGTTIGSAGHVCIVTSANVLNFKSFDANWPAGSYPHIQDHNYTGVLGWLRFKGVPTVVVDKNLEALKQIKTIVNGLAI